MHWAGPAFAAQCTAFSLYSAAAGGNQWAPVPGAGRPDLQPGREQHAGHSSPAAGRRSAQLVLTSKQGYLLAPDGELLSGPVTGQGSWQAAPGSGTSGPGTSGPGMSGAPCKPGAAQDDGQPAGGMLAATSASGLVLACSGQAAGRSQPKTVYTSADGGQTWQRDWPGPRAGHSHVGGGHARRARSSWPPPPGSRLRPGGAAWTAGQGALPAGGFGTSA